MKLIFYLVVAYLLVRAVINLGRAMRSQGGVGASSGPGRGRQRGTPRGNASPQGGGEERATRLRDDEDVEDARWEDL